MTETKPNDRQSPAVPRFAGLASVRLENGTYQLCWAAASHDHTDPTSVRYEAFISENPGPIPMDRTLSVGLILDLLFLNKW